jgi:hypothetical protein
MIRVLVLLFWLSLLIGTLIAHNLLANWAVTLGGLYFLARWWRARSGGSRAPKPALRPATWAGSDRGRGHSPVAPGSPAAAQPHSRWTVDRVHVAQQRWR